MDPRKSRSISEHRKVELLRLCRLILTDLIEVNGFKAGVFGSASMAQEVLNRIEQITKKPDEYQWLVDCCTFLIQKSKGAEIEVVYKGRVISKTDLFKDFGILVAPSKKLKEKEIQIK